MSEGRFFLTIRNSLSSTKETDITFYLDVVKKDGGSERLEEAPSEGNVMNRIIELFEASQED